MQDISDRLPFSLNENSKPKASQVSGIWQQANDFVNAWCGFPSDRGGEIAGLKVVERDIAVNYCLYWHKGYAPRYELSRDNRIMLDNYKTDKLVRYGNLNFDED